ncbi:hypothetical protein P3377_23905 [Vibrio parahaemolyticus]|nr:hypothetical protein [Vibrio parahaemolyticus]HAS6630804.1 hypothetical protein [Vibrio parahaemolyticus]
MKKNAIALKATFPMIEINEDSWDFHITESSLIEELVDVVDAFIAVAIEDIEKQVFIVQS